MKCSECTSCRFVEYSSGVNRYYCEDQRAAAAVNAGARLICRTQRHSKEIAVKNAPRWCPRKYDK